MEASGSAYGRGCLATIWSLCLASTVFGSVGALADEAATNAAAALSVRLETDDVITNANRKNNERRLVVQFSVTQSSVCFLTIHRESRQVWPWYRQGTGFLISAPPTTYYMVPLDKVSSDLVVSNVEHTGNLFDQLAVYGTDTHYEDSENTMLPLRHLKTDVKPVEWGSKDRPPSFPTYPSSAAANAALAALLKASASCSAAPSPDATPASIAPAS